MNALEQAKQLLTDFLASFEAAVYSGADAERLVAYFEEIARLAGAGKILASKQVAATGEWKRAGYTSKEDWYARRTGTSRSAAAEQLATAERMEDLPDTEAAFRSGQLTPEQAAAVSSAASVDPSAERKLLVDAKERSISGLRQECQKVRHAAGEGDAQNRERIHASRYFRHWTDEDGAFMVKGRMTPEDGATLLAGLTPHRAKVFAEARRAGQRDRHDAYELDSLIRMARTTGARTTGARTRRAGPTGGGPSPTGTTGTGAESPPDDGPAATSEPGVGTARESRSDDRTGTESEPGNETGPLPNIVLRVDYPAFLRGYTLPGETSEIVGVGSVPIETVRRYAEDAVYRAVLWDGSQIRDLRTIGRNISANLRRALLERDQRCCVPGCERTHHLQNHHLTWVNAGGPTSLDNLARVCTFHHDQITYQKAYLAGPHPNWVWYPPGTKPPDVRGFYDPAPDEVLDGLDVDHEPDLAGEHLVGATAGGADQTRPFDRLF